MLELCAKSGDRGEHGHLETSIHSSTVHWHILCCNRNRGLHVARPAPSFQTGGMLIRHGRATGEKHIRASRFIGWIFLAVVGAILLQSIRILYSR